MTAKLLVFSLYLIHLTPLLGDNYRFNRDIRPILSEFCYECHGPAESKPKGNLRLSDYKSSTNSDKNRLAAIHPGSVEKSLALQLIKSHNTDEQMPPPETGKKLNDEQIKILESWIQDGAKYESHWSFSPPSRAKIPIATIKNKNPIDAFITAGLKSSGLKKSKRANRRTLIRRLSLDLTGLPPSVEEVNAYIQNKSHTAADTLIERLLHSPHHGERMAQDWLDAVRYADTTGYAADKPRTNWLYRDWVIAAYNKPMAQT